MKKHNTNIFILIELIAAFVCLITAGINFYVYPNNFYIGFIWVFNAIIWAVNAALIFYRDN